MHGSPAEGGERLRGVGGVEAGPRDGLGVARRGEGWGVGGGTYGVGFLQHQVGTRQGPPQ